MNKIKTSPLVVAVSALILLNCASSADADIPGLVPADTIDLSLGTDAYALQQFQLNHATHKLYVTGYPTDSTRNLGLKVIDTRSNRVMGGIDLGRYTGDANWFTPLGFAIDESEAPLGNKLYVVGRADVINSRLRVIDGESDTNLTDESTDVFLPVDYADESFESLAVNSANHKVYIARYDGGVVVVDGPNRQVLTTLHPDAGNLLVANPAANKIFVVNHNGGAVIDSSNDTFTTLALPFFAVDGVLNPAAGTIYFAGSMQSGSYGVFAVDGTTGELITSRTGIPETPISITYVSADNTVRIGTRILAPTGFWIWSIQAFDGTDLSPRGTMAESAVKLAYDSASPNGLYVLRDPQQPDDLQNMVGALEPSTGAMQKVATGYRPYELAMNNRTNLAYVTDEQTCEILVIDGTSHAVIGRIPILPTRPPGGVDPISESLTRHVGISERLNRIYLQRTETQDGAPGASFLDVFDGENNQFRESIALDPGRGYSDFVVVDDARHRVYLQAATYVSTLVYQGWLMVYDADTQALVTAVDLGTSLGSGRAFGMAVNPVTGRVYVSTGSGVAIIDGNTNTKVGDSVLVYGEIALNRRTNKVYVSTSDGTSSGVAVIDGATGTLETNIPIQSNNDSVVDLDIDEGTNRLYVAHSQYALNGRLTAYDGNNGYQFLGQTDLDLKPARITFNGATRQLFVSNDFDGVFSVFQAEGTAPADHFGNLSTRAYLESGDSALIGGFVVTGTQPKTVVVRGTGPSLPVAGALADPVIELHGSSGELIATNDNWRDDPNWQQVSDSGVAPTNDLESALWESLNPGAYTVVVRGNNGASGVGLFEVYDVDHTSEASLANISTRGRVEVGDSVMIAGVIVSGSKSGQVVIRALGPSLGSSGLADALEDPVLELHDTNGGLITSNDDWQEHEAEVTATGLAPTDPRESAIVATLFPAGYTAIVRGKDGATGVALVEAYYLTQ